MCVVLLGCAAAVVAARAAIASGAIVGAASGVPTGPPFESRVQRPIGPGVRICAFGRPLCVHARPGAQGESRALAALADLESAYERLVGALGLPAPLEDGARGGGPEFDVYLVAAEADREVVEVGRDEPDVATWDRASAFALVDERTTGCARANLVARAYASAIGWRLDAAERAGVRDGRAAYLAEIAAPCAAISSELVDDFQRSPERSLTADSSAPANWLFHAYLDTALATAPGGASLGLSFLAPQRSPPGAFSWTDEPDLFDALGATLAARPGSKRSTGDLLLDFSVARLFVGDRDDGAHALGAGWAGSFGRVRFEWSVPFATLPRRLAPRAAIEPTGATYLWVDLTGAPSGARLSFRAEWEAPIVFHWMLLRVGRDGREVSRVEVTAQEHSTVAERNVLDLDGLAGVAIVGVNDGQVSKEAPFDPDAVPFEPHGYGVTLSREP